MPLVKSVLVRLGVSGQDDVKAKLAAVAKRADELARMDPTIRVQVDIAAAAAKLAILREDLKNTANAGSSQRFTFGQGSSGFFGAIQKGLASILNLGPQAIPVLGGIALAVAAIVTYLGSLITELAAAGIGVGAFAAFAIPTFMKIVGGIQAVSGAADKTARSAAWKAIPAALQPAVKAGLQLKGTFDKLVTAMQPQVVRIFGDALKVVGDLLPQLLPIAHSVGKAIDGLLKGFDGFVKSAGFKAFMSQMDALSGPAVKAIGQGLGQIAIALGNLITAAASPNGLLLLKGTFWLLAHAIDAVAFSIRTSQKLLVGFVLAVASVGRGMINVAKTITDGFLTMVGTIARIAALIPGPWQKSMSKISGSIDRAKMTADNFFAGATVKLNQFTSAVNAAKPIYKLQGDMTDLQNKVAASKALLKTVPPSHQTAIRADISQALQQIAAIKFALAQINGTGATTYVRTIYIPGVRPAATGGWRSGPTMVNEQGPEIIDLPPGSYVHTAAESRQMRAAGTTAGGGGGLTINNLYVTTPDGPALVRTLQDYASKNGGIRLKVRS